MKWFKHESSANMDAKLKKVLMRYGAEGYGLYWYCLELIAGPIDKNNLTFELEHDIEILAHDLRLDSLRVQEIMQFMVRLDLFGISATTNRITCLKLAARLENSIVKNPRLREIQALIQADDPGSSGTIREKSGQTRLDKNREKTCSHSGECEAGQEPESRCPVQQIIDLYNKTRKLLPQAREVSDQTRRNISARWRSNPQYRSLEFWEKLFRYCEANKFLSGQTDTGFTASLAWIVLPTKFAKIVNNEYRQK